VTGSEDGSYDEIVMAWEREAEDVTVVALSVASALELSLEMIVELVGRDDEEDEEEVVTTLLVVVVVVNVSLEETAADEEETTEEEAIAEEVVAE
jgi:hypothetical protein